MIVVIIVQNLYTQHLLLFAYILALQKAEAGFEHQAVVMPTVPPPEMVSELHLVSFF